MSSPTTDLRCNLSTEPLSNRLESILRRSDKRENLYLDLSGALENKDFPVLFSFIRTALKVRERSFNIIVPSSFDRSLKDNQIEIEANNRGFMLQRVSLCKVVQWLFSYQPGRFSNCPTTEPSLSDSN